MELRILLGAEILYTDMTCRLLAEGRVPTLAGTEYVLVEFMPGVRYDALYKALEGILRAGYLPVVAHVERYAVPGVFAAARGNAQGGAGRRALPDE